MPDRWLEVDLDWFDTPPWDDRVAEFAERVAPLLRPADDLRGVILNIGFLVDIVTEFTGDPEQRLPLRSRRFRSMASLTYGQLGAFVSQLTEAFDRRGVDGVRIGILVAGLGQVVYPEDTGVMYDLYSDWHDRHPELYHLDLSRLPGPDLDPRVPLEPDEYPYAAFPDGLAGGESFGDVLGAQWGELSRALGLGCLHLRDGFITPMLYSRAGPYGVLQSPDPMENASWTQAVTGLIRSCKDANPDALVMAYSSGISGTAEWFSGCVDFEAVIADSGLDLWVDQTWGGAWQDWWDDHWKGWTFQHADLLLHATMVAGANQRRTTPCRQYNLIETFDGWEPWDTIHRTPGKLAWATWAFSHAAVIGPDARPITPDGSYISWMNDWDLQLLSADDVAFVAEHLDAAEHSAGQIEEVYGPLLVHDRAALRDLADEAPATNASQWVEDHAGFAMKFGLPVIAATRTEWLAAAVGPEGCMLQLPGGLDEPTMAAVHGAAGPVLAVGRADRVHGDLLRAAGVSGKGPIREADYHRDEPSSSDLPPGDSVHLPDHHAVEVMDDADVRYAAGAPLLVTRGQHGWWQPPDLVAPGDPQLPTSQIGTIAPYVEVSRWMNGIASDAGGLAVGDVPVHAPVTVQVWRSAGDVHVLVGNLENGWIGDARWPREVRLRLPRDRFRLHGDVGAAVVDQVWGPIPASPPPASPRVVATEAAILLDVAVGPRGFVVVRLEQREGSS